VAILDLLKLVAEKGRVKDEKIVREAFSDLIAKVLTINGRDVAGQVAGIGDTKFTYKELLEILREHLIAVRAPFAEEAEAARIEKILTEALK